MSLPIRVSAEAAEEFGDAAGWCEERRSGLGDEFIDAVESALELIALWPGTGSPVADILTDVDVRRAPVGRFPYNLVYLVAADHLRLLAVAHDCRRPRYWAPRTNP